MRNKLTGHSIESVGQPVGVRSDNRCGQITFGVDTAACRTVVPATHPATRGYRCHWSAEAGVPFSTAGKSVVWDDGRRLLVTKDAEGKLMTIESGQAEVRSPSVKSMTQQGQMGLFRACVRIQNRDWQINDANSKLPEVMDIMMTRNVWNR